MNDDWLWDGTLPEDPDDRQISASLSGLSRERPCPDLPERPARRAPTRRSWPRVAAVLALAAALLLLIRWPAPSVGWEVLVLAGPSPCGDPRCTLFEGDRLETQAEGRLVLSLGEIGTLEMGPDTRLGRLPAERGVVLDLEAGTVAVSVVAPPRDLRIQTPAAWVVDLGCAYTLTVDPSGTHLSVQDGSVALETPLGVSVVTAGSRASVRPGQGPELPLRDDASAAFVAATRTIETGDGAENPEVLRVLLDHARPEDLITLWHIFQLVPEGSRQAVLDTMLTLAPGTPPDREALLRLEPGALIGLWQHLVPVALDWR